MVWTFLDAEAAVVADIVVFCHMKDLELRLRIDDLEDISCDAECAEKDCPWNVRSYSVCGIVNSEEHADPYPELERIRYRSERTEIAAPEHVDDEASDNYHADGYD